MHGVSDGASGKFCDTSGRDAFSVTFTSSPHAGRNEHEQIITKQITFTCTSNVSLDKDYVTTWYVTYLT